MSKTANRSWENEILILIKIMYPCKIPLAIYCGHYDTENAAPQI